MLDSRNVPATAPPNRWRIAKILFALFGVLIVVGGIACLYENRRGYRNWEAFRTEWQAKGELFDFASLVSPPPPREQNFAMTPLLAPLLEYRHQPGQPTQWSDPPGSDYARSLGDPFKPFGRRKPPMLGQWQSCQLVDLKAWQEFFDGNTNFPFATSPSGPARDVLMALRKYDADLEEVARASARPFSVFPIHYQENFNALLPHLGTLRGISQIVRLRAVARLGAGQEADALSDAQLGLRLAETLKTEPLLISQLVRLSMIQVAMQPIWEGFSRQEWNETQLAGLQSALARVRVLEDYGRTIRGERALGNAMIEDLRLGRIPLSSVGDQSNASAIEAAGFVQRLIPDGWFFQNQLTLNRLYQERCLPLVDLQKHRVDVRRTENAEDVAELKGGGIYNFFANLVFPAVAKTAMKFAQGQTSIDLATVACALERHRLTTGRFPEQLTALVPRYLDRIPTDVISGQSLSYRESSPGHFVIYSVGWNESDDGGEIGAGKPGVTPDPKKGDWVWRYELQ